MTHSLRHFGIVVHDLDKALDFYCAQLGFKVARRMEESGGFLDTILNAESVQVTTVKLAADEGQTLLELLRFAVPYTEKNNACSLFSTGPTHFALTVGDLLQVYKQLQSFGTKFLSTPQTSPDGMAMVAFCRDPEGNLIELVQNLEP